MAAKLGKGDVASVSVLDYWFYKHAQSSVYPASIAGGT